MDLVHVKSEQTLYNIQDSQKYKKWNKTNYFFFIV